MKPTGHQESNNHFPPHTSNEPLNALLPPPPPPPVTTQASSTREKPKIIVDEFIMDTKIVQLTEAAGEDSNNSIQVKSQLFIDL